MVLKAPGKTDLPLLAQRYGVKWQGRRYDPKDWDKGDVVNQCISAATSACMALPRRPYWLQATPRRLALCIRGSPLSFVYDIADIVKFEGVVPKAFEIAASSPVP